MAWSRTVERTSTIAALDWFGLGTEADQPCLRLLAVKPSSQDGVLEVLAVPDPLGFPWLCLLRLDWPAWSFPLAASRLEPPALCGLLLPSMASSESSLLLLERLLSMSSTIWEIKPAEVDKSAIFPLWLLDGNASLGLCRRDDIGLPSLPSWLMLSGAPNTWLL